MQKESENSNEILTENINKNIQGKEMSTSSQSYKLITHPIVSHQLTHLRNKNTPPSVFRSAMNQVSKILAYEATSHLSCRDVTIDTPMVDGTSSKVIDNDVVLVSIMRAGNGMLEGFLQMIPFAKVGHIGIYRDKFINNTVEYYFKVPKFNEEDTLILIDPMVATGDTCVAAINRLKEYGAKKIRLVSVLISPQAIERINTLFSEVEIFTLSVEEKLDSKGYLIPGMGDAGDRFYGTL